MYENRYFVFKDRHPFADKPQQVLYENRYFVFKDRHPFADKPQQVLYENVVRLRISPFTISR